MYFHPLTAINDIIWKFCFRSFIHCCFFKATKSIKIKSKTGKNAATCWQLLTPGYACLSHDMLSIYQVRFFPGNPS